MAERPPLFCPFCRECYEDEEVCPEHELRLVPFDRLPRERRSAPPEGEPVPLHELRFGRGVLLLGAILLLLGMAAPLVTTGASGLSVTATGYELAADEARNLWIVPAVAAALLSILVRRRTPAAMRGSRLAVPLLSLLVLGSVGYTLWRIHRVAQLRDMSVAVEWGVIVLLLGFVAAVTGGLRLGGAFTSRAGTGAPPPPP
ncbi:MAG: hypothetical protein ACODAU_03300 [Myxococcota bacterium]